MTTPTWNQITEGVGKDVVFEAVVDDYIVGVCYSPLTGPHAYAHDRSGENGQTGTGYQSVAIRGKNVDEYIENGKVKAMELLDRLKKYQADHPKGSEEES